jgi:prevent-host-death family protein
VTRTGIADLKNNLSRYLNVVRGGGEVVVFDRDTPVARIVPFARAHRLAAGAAPEQSDPEDERLAVLERQGLIRRGDRAAVRDWLRTHRPVRLPRGGGSVVETLLEMRREDAR